MEEYKLKLLAFLFVFLFFITVLTLVFFIPEIVSGGQCTKNPSTYGDNNIKDEFRDIKNYIFYASIGSFFVAFCFLVAKIVFPDNLWTFWVFSIISYIGLGLLISAITFASLDNTSIKTEPEINEMYNTASWVSGGLGGISLFIGSLFLSNYYKGFLIKSGDTNDLFISGVLIGFAIILLVCVLPVVFVVKETTDKRLGVKLDTTEKIDIIYNEFIVGKTISELLNDLKTGNYKSGESFETAKVLLREKILSTDFYTKVFDRKFGTDYIRSGLEMIDVPTEEINTIINTIITDLANYYYNQSEYILVSGKTITEIESLLDSRVSSGNITSEQKVTIMGIINSKTHVPTQPVTTQPATTQPATLAAIFNPQQMMANFS